MADQVPVALPTSGSTAPVAAESIGTRYYQQIKLVDGRAGSTVGVAVSTGAPAAAEAGVVVRPVGPVEVSGQTTGAPSVSALGQPVWIAGGQATKVTPVYVSVSTGIDVVVQNVGPINVNASGTVQVSGPVQVSGTLNVATVASILTLLGTVLVSGAVQATVSGPVSISNVAPVTTAASVSVTGLPVWLNPTQQIVVSGFQGQSVSAVVSGTVTVSNGASVTIQQGASVSAQVSGAVSISNVAPVTTAASVSVTGVPVWLNPTQQVVVSGLAGHSITGSVNVVSTVTVTGSVAISNMPAVSISGIVPVTTQASVSVTGLPVWFSAAAQVSVPTVGTVLGTVAVNVVAGGAGGGSVTTAAPSISATGQVMWLVGGQSTTASPVFVSQINPPAGGGGSVTTAAPSISATGQIMFIVGGQSTTALPVFISHVATQVVSVVPGLSVSAVVSGTVTVQGIVPVTTAASVSVSGLPVWLNPTQQVVVSGLAGVSVSAVVSGTVSVLNVVPVTTAASVSVTGLPVWLNPTQAVNVGSIASTVNVAIVAGAAGGGSVTTTQASGVTGQLMWLAASQTVYVSIPASQTVGTIVTLLGTVNVAQANIAVVTTAASVSVSGLPVWLNPTQQVVVSGFAGQSVSAVVSGTVSVLNVVPVTTAASVSVTGIPVWLNPTQTVAVSGGQLAGAVVTTTQASGVTGQLIYLAASQTIIVSGQVVQTTTQASGVTGALMYLAASQTVFVSSSAGNPFLLIVTSTVGGSAGTSLLFTIYTGASQAAAGTTQWAVPAGKVLRLLNINAVINSSAVTGGTAQLMILAATASASFTSGSQATIGHPMILQLIVSAGVTGGSIVGAQQDVAAATTIAVFQVAATAMVIGNIIVMGYLF